jgi:hypothetical protein
VVTFEQLMAEVTRTSRFGHRQHVQLTWLAVRAHGTEAAIALVSEGIQATARYAGVPQKYHVTMSRAWVELVAHHAAHDDTTDFDTFAEHHPRLLDKRLLQRFYSSATLASSAARTGWVEPDLAPFPWLAPQPAYAAMLLTTNPSALKTTVSATRMPRWLR